MTYLPFARKWRPKDFDEIVGQEHITTILKNAISMGRLHHAYLFAGPRGIGKTSTARILSKALDCEKGVSSKPCNVCAACKEITNGTSIDVIEIDGASNRGIDEIRDLRQTVKFSPSKGKFKIYIIDEVHMLTTEAFNALLKTLEEPPVHVKFIFATTEPHKLPSTILSRCQRFDFRRISLKEIVAKLDEVAKLEKLDAEEGVLLYIAKASDGSMRDAESILDQVSSFSKGKVMVKDVVEALGMIDEITLFECVDFIINKETGLALGLVNKIFDSGKDSKVFLLELLGHFRNIMVAKVGASSENLIDLPQAAIKRIVKQSEFFSQGDVFYIMNVISNSLSLVKKLLPEKIVLELCMVKLTSRDSIVSIENILSKIPELKEEPKLINVTKAEPSNMALTQDAKAIPKHVEGGKHSKSNIDISRAKDAWPILVKAMAVKKMSLSSYLQEGEPESVKGDIIHVAFPRELNFHREVLEEKDNKDAIEKALSQIMDEDVKLTFIATDRKIEKPAQAEAQLSREDLKKKEPIIDSALNIFGGKILKGRSA